MRLAAWPSQRCGMRPALPFPARVSGAAATILAGSVQLAVSCLRNHPAKENVGKFFVVVLAGVDKDGHDLRMAQHFMHERRDFREVGVGADDIQDFQALAHEMFDSSVSAQYNIVGNCAFGAANAPFARKKHCFGARAFESIGNLRKIGG
jgi:hypothetical protein